MIDRQRPPVRACLSARRKSGSSRCSPALRPAGPPPTIRFRASAAVRGRGASASGAAGARRRAARAAPRSAAAWRRRSRPSRARSARRRSASARSASKPSERRRRPARRSGSGRRRRRRGRRGRGPRRAPPSRRSACRPAMYSRVLVGLIVRVASFSAQGIRQTSKPLRYAGSSAYDSLAEVVQVRPPRQARRVDLDRRPDQHHRADPGRVGQPGDQVVIEPLVDHAVIAEDRPRQARPGRRAAAGRGSSAGRSGPARRHEGKQWTFGFRSRFDS